MKHILLFLAALVLGLAGLLLLHRPPAEVELRVGVFAGSLWGVPQTEAYGTVDAAIARFEAAHPNVHVTYVSGIKREDYSEWLAERVLEGTEPDVFLLLPEDFNIYASLGELQDLSSFAQGDKSFDAGVFYPAALAYGRYEGKLCALPCESVPTLMFVNKTLLAQEGIPMPRKGWTWQDFLAICRQVTRDADGDGVIEQFGCYDYSWQLAAVTNGLSLFREDGRASRFADERMAQAVRFLRELRALQRGCEVTARDFDLGRVAFRPFTFAEYRTYKPYPWRIKKYSSFEWDCIPLPAGPAGSGTTFLGTMLMGMSARTHHEQLAWDFLKTLCYDREMQQLLLQKSQGLPARRDVVLSPEAQALFQGETPGSESIHLADISAVMEEAVMLPKFKKYDAAMLYADTELKKIIEGTMSQSNALGKLQKEVNGILRE